MSRLFRRSLEIAPDVRLQYRAAGVLPHFRKDGRSWFLLGRDAQRQSDEMAWSDFGGKVEQLDGGDPWVTAVREFREETEPLQLPWVPADSESGPAVWNPGGKYVLFLSPSPSFLVPATRVFDKALEKRQFAWVRAKDALEYALDKTMPPLNGYAEPSENAPPVALVHLFRFFASTLRAYYTLRRTHSRESDLPESSLVSSSSSSGTNLSGLDGSAGGGGGKSAIRGVEGAPEGGGPRTATAAAAVSGAGGGGNAPVEEGIFDADDERTAA
jgi:hypothetical protein